jgi:hypothetical protein
MSVAIRRLTLALTLCCALLVGTTAYADGRNTPQKSDMVAAPTPSPSVEERKLAKTRFVADAALAAGATYHWIVKPYKEGKFKKHHPGRTMAIGKAGLAGAFAYNRLKAAVHNAEADPALSKALAPLFASIEALKELPHKLHGNSAGSAVNNYDDVISKVKDAGSSAGAEVKDQVPSASQLMSGS